MNVRNVGSSARRVDDIRLITGHGRYVDDMVLPGMLEIAFVRSAEAHATLKAVDTAAARELPGVVAVWTKADLGPMGQKPMVQSYPHAAIEQNVTQHPLSNGEVCYVGEAIAMVLAEDRFLAEDAAQLVEVEYESLPVVVDARVAAKPDSPAVHLGSPNNIAGSLALRFGDVEEAFSRAPHVFRESYFQHRGGSQSLEGRAVLAQFEPGTDQLTIWTSSQSPFLVRRYLAQYLEREEELIRVIAPDVGGGFGPKAVHYPEELLAAIAAIRLQRPVKWTGDRKESFLATAQQRDQWWEVETACDDAGKVMALRAHCVHDNGAYLPYGLMLPISAINPFPGSYAIKALDVTLDCVFTHAVPCTSIRGAGRPNVVFVLERTMDLVARNLGLDRAAVRRLNFVQKDQFPYETGGFTSDGVSVRYDSGDYEGCLDLALNSADYSAFESRRVEAARDGRWIGLGMSSYNEDTASPPYEGATVKVLHSGRIYVEVGSCGQGQGLETIVAQIAADQFGVKPEDVMVKSGDTATAAMALSTVGSRVASLVGPSVHIAALEVRDKIMRLAAQQLEVSEKDLEITNGAVQIKGVPGSGLRLGDLSTRLASKITGTIPAGFKPGLESTAFHVTDRPVYANGSNVSEVEVDIETGAVKLLGYWVAHDCGRQLNPALVEDQVIGGVVHGIGNAMFEHMKYDRDSGQSLTNSFSEYLLPLATELPRIRVEHMETPSPSNPLGAKGAGEGGTIPAISCIVSAIEDALKPLGVRVTEFPISPERLLQMIDAAKGSPATKAA